MPSRLRPTASLAAEAVLVGDPGRALLLAQELLDEPKMSNHARGLWGYSGRTPSGAELTIQSTGMGGPSAALVLGDLAELGVRRAVRVGTCVGLAPDAVPGELIAVDPAIAEGGSAAALGIGPGEAVAPDAGLTDRLAAELGVDRLRGAVGSFDLHPGETPPETTTLIAADMQTAPLLARARALGIAAAALLIVAEAPGAEQLEREALELAEKRAGRLARAVLSG
jgi:uridine phosphorylase